MSFQNKPIVIGSRYGKLVIVKEADQKIRNGKKLRVVQCLCDCGVIKNVLLSNISTTKGRTQSCGCTRGIWNTVHGEGGYKDRPATKEYAAWCSMKRRCFKENDSQYKNYGGRGITVCERWKTSYDNFLYDMGRAPTKKHSLDRKENNGNYEPNNCRWATAKEQRNNVRPGSCCGKSVKCEYNGEVFDIGGWTKRLGFSRNRMDKLRKVHTMLEIIRSHLKNEAA